METGSVSHDQEGRLKQECDPGLLNKGCEELENGLLMEANSWLSNTPAPQNSNDKIHWENPPIPNHAAANSSNLEDAKNLVAFSAVAEAMSSYGIPASGTPSLVSSMQLYEKFNYEMNRDNTGLSENKAPQCPEDLNTLQAALTLARHGMKPPNCNCDGPECPDYLEWLESKIKSAAVCHPESTLHPLSQVNKEMVQKNFPKEHVLALENKIAKCPSGTLPFSQNALSIAKEKNISLQTAIAIEALTQLSSALPQSNKDYPNGSTQPMSTPHEQLPHFPAAKGEHGQVLPMTCNDLFNQQSHLYTGKNALTVSQPPRQTSWEQEKATGYQEGQYIPGNNISQGSSSVLPNHTATPQKSDYMEHWGTDSGHPKSPSDPMTGLKQLLGNADDYVKSVFKSPEAVPNRAKNAKSKQISVHSIKKEASDFYRMSPDQQLSHILQETDLHRSAQAALQQHLHHKRNLFVDSNTIQECTQEQPNWWVPKTPASKSLEKPVKERKKRGQSPSQKQVEPKMKPPRKPVLIKKPKQKDTNAVFLPVSQINLEDVRRVGNNENLNSMLVDRSYPNDIKPPGLTSLSVPQNVIPTGLENGHTLNTQEMCTVSQPRDGQMNALCIPQVNPPVQKDMCPTPSTEDTNSTSGRGESINQQSSAGHIPAQNDLNSIDDKFEDLIRQFEAEFGDDFPLPTSEVPSQNSEGLTKQQESVDPQAKLPYPTPVLSAESSTQSSSRTGSALSNVSLKPETSEKSDGLFSSRSPKQIKIESSGAITVLSTTCFYSEENQRLDETPTKSEMPFNPSLSGFLESPLNYLSSPTRSLLDTPAKRAQAEFPTCNCVEQINEKDEGPYYTHLGSGPSVASIRELMEERFGEKGKAIRIEKVVYTGREGKSSRGCPIAKWVIRRQSEEEKLLCLVRHRAGHSCEDAVIIILIMAWEGIPRSLGDTLYQDLTETITKYGNPTSRRCGLNDDRTCACQGKDPNTCGASFSFGCSWSMYFNGCKYARSKTPRKFRLIGDNPKEEESLKDSFQDLATQVAPVYKMLAPQAYTNQVNNEDVAIDCRLGLKEGRPFSGVTACMDFCAHAHKDQHNLYNGCTVVCTLTKEDNRTVGKIAEDEQLHVLPLYKVSTTDEFGSEEGQAEKIRKGGIQVLTSFPREVRKLSEPAKSCRQRQMEAKKAAAEKKKLQKEKLTTPDKTKQEPAEPQPCTQNPGVPPQQVKPCVKVEPSNHYNTFKYKSNGVVESYSVLGSCRPSDPYSMNSVYSYHSFYAQPNMPSMNGFHSKFPLPPFGYYGFPGNPMVPSQFMNYGSTDARTGGWMNNRFEKKPELQSLADGMNHGYGSDLTEQSYMRSSDPSHQYSHQDPTGQKSAGVSHRTTPAPMDTTPFSQNHPCFNKVIKKEPISDLPHVDPFQRASSAHAQSPGLNLASQNSDQAMPYKANGALTSSERTNAEGPCGMFTSSEKANLTNGLEKRDYFGAHVNGIGLKGGHGLGKQWSAYGMNNQTGQHDTQSSGKVWSSCKMNDTSAVLPPPANTPEKNWNDGQAVKEPMSYQEKLWNSAASYDRGNVTPNAGPQERAWNPYANPPVNNLKTDPNQTQWDPYSLDDNVDNASMKSAKEEEDEEEVWSDSEHNFLDENIGGVAVAPAHGSILIECARRELHATTPLKRPNRCHPTRISLVFYQHKNLNQPNHGLALWEAKMKQLAERARARQEEAARLGIKQESKGFGKKRKWGGAATPETPPVEKKDIIPTRQAATLLTNSATTASSYAYTKVTGPYSRWI
ncbi:methylcytosine dioxygenase TET3 isoform X2 [Spea bombifrons]|nr:methylcytosine dioxygenase TET3 isoform X2 [Spea bombifrons]XP_053320554.1 methylcytosine dioxygenase TET3 isoform X2 [Spea bombifrons]XP_053320555.1 methylcytosine dioxygenase TET3 isoform X2 [Spea bombifrons]XP_053320556.1 methylcytosine dioxygenase TET3 isoform X2 [Spea bombifrons]